MTADATPVPKRWDPRKGVPHLSQRKNFEPGTVIGKWTLTGEHKTDPKSRQLRWHAFCECGRDAWPLGASLRAAQAPGSIKARPSSSRGRCTTPLDVPLTYSGAHHQVWAKRGPASAHKCVDCDRQAQDWSYNHNDHSEFVGPERPDGEDMLYSTRVYLYVPRCRRCHRLLDDIMERVRSGEVPPSNALELFAVLIGRLPPLSSHEIVRLD